MLIHIHDALIPLGGIIEFFAASEAPQGALEG
jgi:hypothetical protein